jgi:hypothetical protein
MACGLCDAIRALPLGQRASMRHQLEDTGVRDHFPRTTYSILRCLACGTRWEHTHDDDDHGHYLNELEPEAKAEP